MTERPIIFSGEMVRAILDGRKTQTRRVIKKQPSVMPTTITAKLGFDLSSDIWFLSDQNRDIYTLGKCSYGKPGDLLWVRESWRTCCPNKTSKEHIAYKATQDSANEKWRPSIHMPKWASRIWLKMISVRPERVQEISEEDEKAEGIVVPHRWSVNDNKRCTFGLLWDSLNANRGFSWQSNPWVWRIEFERLER